MDLIDDINDGMLIVICMEPQMVIHCDHFYALYEYIVITDI